jgi:hypothetical protein
MFGWFGSSDAPVHSSILITLQHLSFKSGNDISVKNGIFLLKLSKN